MPRVPQAQRQPKAIQQPSIREVKVGADPESLEKETIAWQFYRQDRPHLAWGWDKLRPADWRDILRHLVSFEGLTWARLKEQAGGRRRGTNHHSLHVTQLNAAARRRLTELHLDEFDTVFSLRINNTLRLYGIRDGRVLQLVWHDPHHGSGRGACPVR